MAAIVIADASPLIALARVNGLGWLKALFGQVLVREEVLCAAPQRTSFLIDDSVQMWTLLLDPFRADDARLEGLGRLGPSGCLGNIARQQAVS